MSDESSDQFTDETFEPNAAKPGKKSSVIVRASDIQIRLKDWLWEGHLLRGAQEILAGQPGLGKSQVQCSLIACVTAGLLWPDRSPGIAPANVIMLTAEDALDQEVVPRLIAAGADLDRVHILKSIKTDEKHRQFLLAEDLEELEMAVKDIGDVSLVTIDPITAYMGGKMDSHKATEVRSQLGPLKDLAERLNVAVSTITHPAKNAGGRALDQFIGSQAFIAHARIAHVCVEEVEMKVDDDGPKSSKTGRILFANAKNNTHTRRSTLAYRIQTAVIGQDLKTHDAIVAPYAEWNAEAVDISADEAVAAASSAAKGARKTGSQTEVQAFLKSKMEGGGKSQQEIEGEALQRGYTRDQLKRAKKQLGIVSKKNGMAGQWFWDWQM